MRKSAPAEGGAALPLPKTTEMTTTIQTSSIFAQALTLSSFDGREQKDANGESMYLRLHLQDRDAILIKGYALEAASDLSKYTAPFCEHDFSVDELTWAWKDSYEIMASVPTLIERYLVNWVMAAWLLDKAPERSKYYADEATRLATGIPGLIFRTKPKLS